MVVRLGCFVETKVDASAARLSPFPLVPFTTVLQVVFSMTAELAKFATGEWVKKLDYSHIVAFPLVVSLYWLPPRIGATDATMLDSER